MKSAASLLFLLLWSTQVPLYAQQPPEPHHRAMLAIGGELSWGVGINGEAVGWSMANAHPHVTIAARLGNGGGHAYVDAYLMKKIGPDATEEDEIARTSFDLPYPFSDWVTLFADLDLEPGVYWLVIAKPRERAFSSINWIVGKPMLLRSCCDINYLGTKSYTFLSDAADYIPASNFKSKYEPYGFQIEITEAGLPDDECSKSDNALSGGN